MVCPSLILEGMTKIQEKFLRNVSFLFFKNVLIDPDFSKTILQSNIIKSYLDNYNRKMESPFVEFLHLIYKNSIINRELILQLLLSETNVLQFINNENKLEMIAYTNFLIEIENVNSK